MISTLLNQLVESGLTEAEIAKAIGRNQSSVNRMRHGQRTDYETGLKIQELHRQKVAPGAQDGAAA